MKTTHKKTKLVGTETYINQNTGELVDMKVLEVEERDANFHKLWVGHIAQALDIIGSKKIKVLFHILDNLNNENLLLKTQRELVEETGISLQAVSRTLQALQEGDFLTKIHSGMYRINPEVIFKGGYNHRMNILIRYRDEKAKNEDYPLRFDRDERRKKIEELQRQLTELIQQEAEETTQESEKARKQSA